MTTQDNGFTTYDIRLAAYLAASGHTITGTTMGRDLTMFVHFAEDVSDEEVLAYETGAMAPAKTLMGALSKLISRASDLKKKMREERAHEENVT